MVDTVEGWRKAMNLNEKFTIAGHSYGGYISSFYTLNYSKYLKKTILISPIGSTAVEENEVENYEESMMK